MFITIIVAALLIQPDWSLIFQSILFPTIPEYINKSGSDQSIEWTLGLMGGVGGTLTILAYGYWMIERGRTSLSNIKVCRLDLSVSYIVTAIFGMAMVIISSRSDLEAGSSSLLILNLANQLHEIIGEPWTTFFLLGAWAAVFSSLLGVWQSVPYIFTDAWNLSKLKGGEVTLKISEVNTKSKPYRSFLLALSIIPMLGLTMEFVAVQKIYALLGSMVIPLFAVSLLILNGKEKWVGEKNTNKNPTVAVLVLIVFLFLYIGFLELFQS